MPAIAERQHAVKEQINANLRLKGNVFDSALVIDTQVPSHNTDKYVLQRAAMKKINERRQKDPEAYSIWHNSVTAAARKDEKKQISREHMIAYHERLKENPLLKAKKEDAQRLAKSSLAAKQRTSEANRKRWESLRAKREMEIIPLVMRGFSNRLIAEVVELDQEDVQRFLRYRERIEDKNGKLDFVETKEGKKQRTSKGQSEVKKIMHRTPEQQEAYRGHVIFAQKLQSIGAVTSDLSIWHNLMEKYGKAGRSLPDDSVLLRLESLAVGLDQSQKGNNDLLDTYKKLVREIDGAKTPKNIAVEEKFIQGEKVIRGQRVTELCSQYYGYMFSIAKRYVGCDTAVDLVQTAVTKLLSSNGKLPPNDPEQERAFLGKVIGSIAISEARAEQVRPETIIVYHHDSNYQSFENEDSSDMIGRYGKEKSAEEVAIPRIYSQRMIEAIFKHAGEVDPIFFDIINGLNYKSIAIKYKIKIENARLRYSRSLLKLRSVASKLNFNLDLAS